MKKILYISKHNPWGCGGGPMASKMYLEAFIGLFKHYEIDLLLADTVSPIQIPESIKANQSIHIHYIPSRTLISKIMSPLTNVTHRFQKPARLLLSQNEYEYVVFDHSSIAGSLSKYVPFNTKSIVIHHNFEQKYYADNTRNLLHRIIFLPVVEKCEKTAYRNSTVNIFLTQEDLDQFVLIYGHNHKSNIVSGIFEVKSIEKNQHIPSLIKETPTIVITGSLDNIQNIDGIKYFINELYPEIPLDYKIIIAGKDPNQTIYDMLKGKTNIDLIPNPVDMQDIVCRGNIFLSPARLGSGIKVRITDGLKCGLPVIAHKTSSRGYGSYISKGYFKVFSTHEDFSRLLKELVDEIYNEKIKPEDITKMYNSLNTFESGINNLLSILAVPQS